MLGLMSASMSCVGCVQELGSEEGHNAGLYDC